MQVLICDQMNEKYNCHYFVSECPHKIRHEKKRRLSRQITTLSSIAEDSKQSEESTPSAADKLVKNIDGSAMSPITNLIKTCTKDVIFSELIDTIHCYFLQYVKSITFIYQLCTFSK